MSSKLFDSTIKQNNFKTLKDQLKNDYKIKTISSFGRTRIGNSTFQNIFINNLMKTENRKIFREENNMQSVTNGADYFIYTNDKRKEQTIVIDCEGYGNNNNKDLMKLILLVCVISDIIVFHVDKAFEDESFIPFISQTILYYKKMNLRTPQIYIIIKDTCIKFIQNCLKKFISNEKELVKKIQLYFYEKFTYKEFIISENILFIPPPPRNKDGFYNIVLKTSHFFKQSVLMSDILKNKLEKMRLITDFSEKELILNYFWEYNLDFNHINSLEFFMLSFIEDLIMKKFNDCFGNNQVKIGLKQILEEIAKKKQELSDLVLLKANLIFLSIDPLIKQKIVKSINEKFSKKIDDINKKYNTEKLNYDAKRNSSQKSEVICNQRYVPTEYYHTSGYSEYCSDCKRLYYNKGCRAEYYHPGGKRWFMWAEWHTCCDARWDEPGCEAKYHHSGYRVDLYDCCKNSKSDSGCKTTPGHYTNDYVRTNLSFTMEEWKEEMFKYEL